VYRRCKEKGQRKDILICLILQRFHVQALCEVSFPENFGCGMKSSAQSHIDSLKEMKSQLIQRREKAVVPTKAVG